MFLVNLGSTYSLHCSSLLVFTSQDPNYEVGSTKKGTTMETVGIPREIYKLRGSMSFLYEGMYIHTQNRVDLKLRCSDIRG